MIAFWFLREALMKWAFIPFARRCGIKHKRSVIRFAEQSWMLLYPSESLPVFHVESPETDLRYEQVSSGPSGW